MELVSIEATEFSAALPCRDPDNSPPGHPALTSAHEPILVVTISSVAETFTSVIDEMTRGTDFKFINLLYVKNTHLTHKDLNTSFDEPENR
jgi:hypothetical protein